MSSLRNDNFKTIYIVRESPSEEPMAVFRDLRDAYRFSTQRCMETCRRAYNTVKLYYLIEEALITDVRITVWEDNETGLIHSVAKYNIIDL
jgi:hypothetical protein